MPILFVGLAVAGASFFSSTAHAQTAISFDDLTPANGWQCNTDKSSCTNKNGATASCTISGGSLETGSLDTSVTCTEKNPDGSGASNSTTFTPGGTTVQTDNTHDSNGNTTSANVKTTTPSNPFNCVPLLGSLTGGDSATSCLITGVGTVILSFANFLLGIAGVLFNLVMFYGVFQFANTVGNSPGVLTAWGILRDLANMALLFGFIFMGIATILDTGAVQSFTAKRALPSLLIFAILMNFSLFTCEALIDVSNALSSTMYSQANTDPCIGQEANGILTAEKCTINYGLAGHVMQSTGLAGIWGIKADTSAAADAVTYFGLALFATIGAIVFFAAAIMLAIRVISLTLLMVVSPIGFAGMAIPPLRNMAGNWWQRVIHQAFYAPIMLLLILISLKIADSFTGGSDAGINNALGNSNLATAVINQDTSVMGIILVFMLVIGFMIASLIVANRFGAAGASAAVTAGKKIVLGSYGFAGGVAGRNTLGRSSNWAQKKYNASVASGRLQFLAGTVVDDMAVGALKKPQDWRFGSTKNFKEKKEHHEARHKELAKLERLQEINKAPTDEKMREAVKKLTDAEIAESDAIKKGGEQLERIARALSSEKFEKLMGNDKISDDRKDAMRNARFRDLHEAVKEADAAAKAFEDDPKNTALQETYNEKQKALSRMANSLNGKDIGQLASSTEHSSVFGDPNFAAALSDDQFKEAKKNNHLSALQIQNLETERARRQNDPVHVLNKIKKLTPEDAGKLPGSVLVQRDSTGKFMVLEELSARQLASIDPTKLTNDQSAAVAGYIKIVLARMGDKTSDEFRRLYNTSPELQRRWP